VLLADPGQRTELLHTHGGGSGGTGGKGGGGSGRIGLSHLLPSLHWSYTIRVHTDMIT